MPPHGTLYGATHRNQGEHDMTQTNLNELLAAINEAHAAGNQQELVAELEASLEVFETI